MERKNISLKTVPNGYSLDIEGKGYMYYNLQTLIAGFMYHVGMGESRFSDEETIDKFINAAMIWCEDSGKATRRVLELEEEVSSLKNEVGKQKKTIERIKNSLNETSEERNQLREENKNMKAWIEKLEKGLDVNNDEKDVEEVKKD